MLRWQFGRHRVGFPGGFFAVKNSPIVGFYQFSRGFISWFIHYPLEDYQFDVVIVLEESTPQIKLNETHWVDDGWICSME